ncbi:MAG: hypothetical protein IH905_04485 [Proteobacteria bacterium]|nr:hypothetical protein [Pseudomonadota bacterium]
METRSFPRLVSKGKFVNQFVLELGLGAGQRRLNSFAPEAAHQEGRPGEHYQGNATDAENKDDQVFDDVGTILFSAHSRRGGRIFGFFLRLGFRLPECPLIAISGSSQVIRSHYPRVRIGGKRQIFLTSRHR